MGNGVLVFFIQLFLMASWAQAAQETGKHCQELLSQIGSQRFLPAYVVNKYNVQKIISFQFSPQSLDQLSHFYHNQEVPKFLWRHGRGVLEGGTVYLKRTDDNRFVFALNDPYYDVSYLQQLKKENRLTDLKHSKNGLVLLSWYVHPSLPAQAVGDALKVSNLEKGTTPFLASLLDLKQSDLPSLKILRENTKKVLRDDFGVNEADKVNMYFHFPYMKETMGLHLHIRVNHPTHELEIGKSFLLDEVIEHLEKNGDIRQLILNRQKLRGGTIMNRGSVESTIRELNIPVHEVPNPYYDPHLRALP